MIIVLGEIVSQLVLTASGMAWDRRFVATILPAFFALVWLWWLTFSYGFAGAPNARLALMEPRLGLPMHLLSTAGVVAMAAGFGEAAAHPHEPLAEAMRWIMCGGLALHLLVMAVAGATGGAPRRWLIGWALPSTVLPLLLAVVGGGLGNVVLLWLLVAGIAWMAFYRRIDAYLPRPAR
jgi:low temperature requirement protein LtrA